MRPSLSPSSSFVAGTDSLPLSLGSLLAHRVAQHLQQVGAPLASSPSLLHLPPLVASVSFLLRPSPLHPIVRVRSSLGTTPRHILHVALLPSRNEKLADPLQLAWLPFLSVPDFRDTLEVVFVRVRERSTDESPT